MGEFLKKATIVLHSESSERISETGKWKGKRVLNARVEKPESIFKLMLLPDF